MSNDIADSKKPDASALRLMNDSADSKKPDASALRLMNDFEVIKQIVQSRRTEKVIARLENPVHIDPAEQASWDAIVADAVAIAGLAPFHFDRGVDSVPEPWRVHLLNQTNCRDLARKLGDWLELKESNKIPGMLSACGCTLLVTWLPQFRSNEAVEGLTREKQIEIDDEHLAATAAMVQNLLLLLTAAGLGTYWSSGGVLGGADIFQRLGIGQGQQLLASIFVQYPSSVESHQLLERIPGKNRRLRTPAQRWFSTVVKLQ